MSPAELMNLVRHLVEKVGIFSISLTGGEPLLRKNLFDILGYLSEKGTDSSLFTNATMVTASIARRLSEEPCLRGQIRTSLDGASAGVHDAFRGKNAFAMAVKGIRHLAEAGMKIQANCIINKLNLGSLPEIADLAEELGIRNLGFSTAGIVGDARQNTDILVMNKKELDYAYDVVKTLTQEHDIVAGGTILDWPKERAPMDAEKMDQRQSDEPVGQTIAHCDICKECVTITSDGWMVPCNKFMNWKIGNVLQDDFVELYRTSPQAVAIRGLMELRSDQLEGCEGCEYAAFCSGGCRADAYALSGSLRAPDKFRCIRRYFQRSEDCPWILP